MTDITQPEALNDKVPNHFQIMGVPTSIPAFVGATEFGPVNTPTRISSWQEYMQVFGGAGITRFTALAVQSFFESGGSLCCVVGAEDKARARNALLRHEGLTIQAFDKGSWGNALEIVLGESPLPERLINNGIDTRQYQAFTLDVVVAANKLSDDAAELTKIHTQVINGFLTTNFITPDTIADQAYCVLERFNGLFLPVNSGQDQANTGVFSLADCRHAIATYINSSSVFIRVDTSELITLPQSTTKPVPLSQGSDPQYDYAGALQSLTKQPDVSMLAMPDSVLASAEAGKSALQAQCEFIRDGLQFCQQLGSLFYVVDPPFGLETDAALEFVRGGAHAIFNEDDVPEAAFGASYYPWLKVYIESTCSYVLLPPSGAVLGRINYTDETAGVAAAPAGAQNGILESIKGVANRVTDNQQQVFHDTGLNPICSVARVQFAIWGLRTLSQQQQWLYIPVKRLCIFIEQSILRSLAGVESHISEPGLWRAVGEAIHVFLHWIWQSKALQGASPQEAYYIICDASNNPDEATKQGVLNITIGLAVTQAGQFMERRLRLSTQAAN